MNSVFLTGYLPSDATERTCPKTYVRKLCFDVVSRDSKGVEARRTCFLDSEDLIKKHLAVLDQGRAVIVTGENTDRPVIEQGRTKFIAREIRVLALEVPNRTGVPARVEEEETQAPETGESNQ